MARPVPPERFGEILRAATTVFLEQGYGRTQMADVAARIGLAKGTVYLYFESKEALFEQTLKFADGVDDVSSPNALPVPTPPVEAMLRRVRDRIKKVARLPLLEEAITRRRIDDVRAEVDGIVRELYKMLAAHRVAIKLIDRCAHDYPELAAVWISRGRGGVVSLLERYLTARVRQKRLPAVVDIALTARLILETVVWWAVHRHGDVEPQLMADDVAESAVVEFVGRALRGNTG